MQSIISSLKISENEVYISSKLNYFECPDTLDLKGSSNLEGYWVKGYVHVPFCKHWY